MFGIVPKTVGSWLNRSIFAIKGVRRGAYVLGHQVVTPSSNKTLIQ